MCRYKHPFTLTHIILFVCSPRSQQLGVCLLPEVKLPQRITQMFYFPTIDRIEFLLQYCSCSNKTVMNSISNRVRHTINKLDKTARLVDIIRCLISSSSSSFITPEGSKISHKNTKIHTQNMIQNYT